MPRPSRLNPDPAFGMSHLQEFQDLLVQVVALVARREFGRGLADRSARGRGFIEFDDSFGIEEDVRLLRLLPPEMMGRAELDRIGVAQSFLCIHDSSLSRHGATPSPLPIRLS